MQLVISKRAKNDTDMIPEWFLIELQGSIETSDSVSLAGTFIGDLHFTTKGEPVFIIGHHVLYGKEVKLDKPFGVLKKISLNSSSEIVSTETEPYYECAALIKRKLLFKTRPKPLVVAKKV